MDFPVDWTVDIAASLYWWGRKKKEEKRQDKPMQADKSRREKCTKPLTAMVLDIGQTSWN